MEQLDDAHLLLNQVSLLAEAREKPVERSTLQDELDISRATAYRHTTALTDDDLLEQTPAGYLTTGAGSAVVEAVQRFERSLSAIDRLEPLLAELSAPALTRNVHLFAEADLAVATPRNPSAPVEPWLDHLESFDRSRNLIVAGCPPAVTEQALEHVPNGVDFEAICTPMALEADRNTSMGAFEAIVTAETTSLYTHSGLPFTMGIIDEVVTIAGFDTETSLPVASITTSDPDAREWAELLYRRYKREADPLEAMATEPVG